MKVKIRALRGSKDSSLYGKISAGRVVEVDPWVAKEKVAKGHFEYVDRKPETRLPVKPPAPPEPLPKWGLKTSPADYIKKHGGKKNPSETIAANLELAYKIVGH